MPRFRLDIEYEGTRYRGWQVQKNARTVAGEIATAITSVCGTDQFEFQGAGRTDAGVHALAQVAHLDITTMLAPHILRMKLNDELPPDINIIDVTRAPRGFHARHHATARGYLYQISRRRTALGKRFVWWIKDPLDAPRMNDALRRFSGMHDFASFTEADPDDASTTVEVQHVELREDGDLILIRIVGSHFIWKMVRRMVGVLVEVGRGSLGPAAVDALLRKPDASPAQFTAPPSGLFLERVWYEGDDTTVPAAPLLRVDPPVIAPPHSSTTARRHGRQ